MDAHLSTGKEGRAVAVIANDRHRDDGKVIRIAMGERPNQADLEEPGQDASELLEIEEFLLDPRKFKLLDLRERLAISKYLEDHEEPPTQRGRDIQARYIQKSKDEYRIDAGRMVVLPDEEPERVFVAGKSGSGKSCWAAMYVREYCEMFPNRKVYLLSTHDDEKAYHGLPVIQINLGEEFIKAPPGLEDFRDSLVLFDDCDNLVDKALTKVVDAVSNDLLCNSRKYGTHVLTLHHHLMDHNKTRTLLNESNRVVFYPQGGGYHVQRFLKVYAGLGSQAIQKVMREPSRWVCLDTRLPMSYVTENAVVIVK
jgi:hypothetical protein